MCVRVYFYVSHLTLNFSIVSYFPICVRILCFEESSTSLFAHHPQKKITKKMQHYRPKKHRLSDINRKNVNLHKCITKVENAPSEYTMISADGKRKAMKSDIQLLIEFQVSIHSSHWLWSYLCFCSLSTRLRQRQRGSIEVLGKWRLRYIMAGDSPWGYGTNTTPKYWTAPSWWCPKTSSISQIRNLLISYKWMIVQ